jgi:magnesium transporter
MSEQSIRPELLEMIARADWAALRDAVAALPAVEAAELLSELEKPDRVLVFRSLPRPLATELFAHLEPDEQNALVLDLSDEETRQVLRDLSPDDRTHFIAELPGRAVQRMLNLLDSADLKEARWLLGYPEDSVGRLMTPDYVAVRSSWTVAQALEHIRRMGRDSETVNVVFVVDEKWHLLDDIELRRFILASPDALVSDLMDPQVVVIEAWEDREEAVERIARYDLVALPVVDRDGVLVGIVTFDDVWDVAEAEATEDFQRVGSVEPLRMSLREATVALLYRRRMPWLLALVYANVFSGAGIAYFEDTIAAAVSLVFFLPLLIDSGGNAGSQSATLMVRALATGDVRASDWLALLGKELAVAVLMGATMSLGVAAIAWFRAPEVLWVVCLTMVLLVLAGSLIGMALPLVLTRFGLDPATASAPLITSLADISGVIIYFTVATRLLGGQG